MRRRVPTILLSAALTVGLTLPTLAGAPTDDASVASGKKVFKANCSSCHGTSGTGDGPAGKALKPPPRNLQTEPLKGGDQDDQIFNSITNGLPGTAMASFKQLSEKDRWLLVAYIKSLRKK